MTEAEDQNFVTWMDEQIEQSNYAEQQEKALYEEWKANKLEDGEDEAALTEERRQAADSSIAVCGFTSSAKGDIIESYTNQKEKP